MLDFLKNHVIRKNHITLEEELHQITLHQITLNRIRSTELYHVIHSTLWRDVFFCVTWLTHTCAMIHMYIFWRITSLEEEKESYHLRRRITSRSKKRKTYDVEIRITYYIQSYRGYRIISHYILRRIISHYILRRIVSRWKKRKNRMTLCEESNQVESYEEYRIMSR